MSNNNPHAGHRERMRQRFAEDGFENYRPHEVLEQVLFFAIPRANTNETAHALLSRFGSLEGVLGASVKELQEIPGIGRKAAEYLVSLKGRFVQSVMQHYRDTGAFGVFGLALLADLMLNPREPGKLCIMLFDELDNIITAETVDAVLNDDGGIDCVKTAGIIAERAGVLTCRVALTDQELLTQEQAELIYRTVNETGGRLAQILLTETGSLYLLAP